MGSFVESCLGNNEEVVHEARMHWLPLVVPTFLLVMGLLAGDFGYAVAAVGLVWLSVRLAQRATTELAITNRKVIAKFGIIRRHTIEQQISKVDSVQVNQGLMGRLMNSGSVRVNGSGIASTPIPGIADPLTFRRQVNAMMDALNESQKATG